MLWKTHKVITAFTVLVLTHEPIATLSAAAGSVFPDALEFLLYGRNVPPWKHRTFSHWFLLYFAFLPVLLLLTSFHLFQIFFTSFRSVFSSGPVNNFSTFLTLIEKFSQTGLFFNFACYLLFWFVVGAIFHILEDAITGKVPSPFSLNFERKNWGIKLFQTGSFSENLLFLLFFLLLLLTIYLILKV